MSIKISELPQAANVGNNDFVPIVQNGETKKALASDFGGGGGGTSDYTATLNSISPSASLMNTGSLVGMGDRAELTGTTETEVETKESGDTL